MDREKFLKKGAILEQEVVDKTEIADKLGTDKIDLSDEKQLNDDFISNHIKKLGEANIIAEKGATTGKIELDRPLTEEEIQKEDEKFEKRVDEFHSILQNLNEAERKIFLEEGLTKLGIPVEEGLKALNSDDFAWQKSDIFKTLAIFVIEQEVKNQSVNYDGTIDNWVPTEQFANGVVQYLYHDYTDANETPAWKNVEISDYNQGTNITTYEVYRAKKNIHKGYDIYDSRLNDFAKSTAIFMAIMNDLQMNIARPIAKIIFRYKLQVIANPFTNLEFNGIDITETTPDITINATDTIDFLTKLNTLFGNGGIAYSPSREREERADWNPEGFTTPLELQFSKADTEIMIDTTIWNQLMTNEEVRNTYNLTLLNLPDFVKFNYKLFTTYGKITGISATSTAFDLFVKIGTPLKIIEHYNLSKKSDTPVAKSVVNYYERVGYALNKLFRMYRVRVNITPPATI